LDQDKGELQQGVIVISLKRLPFTTFLLMAFEMAAIALPEIPKKGVRPVRKGKHPISMRLDPLSISYRIEDKAVDLINGRNEKEATPGSASKITTAVLGIPAVGDLNDDGRPDAALILFQNSGGPARSSIRLVGKFRLV
jgi:hypothetical protein